VSERDCKGDGYAENSLKMNHAVLDKFIRVLTHTSTQIYTHFIKDVLCLLVHPSLMSLVESRDYQECVGVSSWKYFSCFYFYIDLIVIFCCSYTLCCHINLSIPLIP